MEKIPLHYGDVIMGTMAFQITSLTIVYSTVYSDANQRKHQSSASLAFERGIHRRPMNSPHKWPVTPKMFPFDDVIIVQYCLASPKMTCNDTNRPNFIKCHRWPMLYPIKEWCFFSVIGRNLNRPEKNRSCVKAGSREGDVELWQLTSICMTITLHKERMIDVLI